MPLLVAQILQTDGSGGDAMTSWSQNRLVYFGEDQRRTQIIQPKERMWLVNSAGK